MVDEAAFQFQREVPFGAADEDRLQEFAQGLVGDLRADAQTGDLLLVLGHPQLFDGSADVREAQGGRDGADRPVAGHGEVVLLDGEGVGALRCGEARGGDGGVTAGARQHVDAQGGVRAAVRGCGCACGLRSGCDAVYEQVLGSAQQEDRAGWGHACEVADVGRAGDQRGGAAAGVDAFP